MAKPTNEELIEYLREVMDPDLGLPIVDLGLIYRAEAVDDHIEIDFTLTSPACPVGDLLEEEIRETAKARTGIDDVRVVLTWNPPWNQDLMTEELKLALGFPI